MTDMIPSFAVNGTLSRVVSLITDEIILAWNLKDDLKGLQESLTMIRAVLQDAEEQQTKSEPVRLWLKKLQEVAYEAEDVFDELAYENHRRKVEMQDQSEKKVRNLLPFSKGTGFVKKAAFHVKWILGEMLQTLNANMGGLTNKDAIVQELEKALEGKKFLLVLDDVWNEVSKRWDDLKTRLVRVSRNSTGNAIVVTTRSEQVASIMETSAYYRHPLNLLSDGEYNKDNVESVLKLSFDHLPPLLKSCFAYCSIFPKDFYIVKEELVKLWMAEGFLVSSSQDEGNKSSKCNNFGIFEKGGYEVAYFILKEIVFDESWKLKRLRTLNLKGANIEELPSSIGKLKHLRYLDVSWTKIEVLPESIIELYNLQH
ncbi:hypothetical protein GH714_037759 [Hevea brasiliensis]|uniref:Rx N-terminal domain-containing protein n=1 Tax=Hevea brasiliensis TaxID=3981 RepID=A0A6A6L4S1_HEVBR|nr:hypothetical protein GH714_037759 [Hevea brasiliensis]